MHIIGYALHASIKGPAYRYHATTKRQCQHNYQLIAKKMKLQLAVLLISVLMRGSKAMPAVDGCLTMFEESLKETMALRRSCEEASLKDCRQVRYY